MKSVIKLLILFSLLAACAPAAPAATPTLTFTPSHTLIPSQTPIPSETPTLAPTITPTFIPTLTSTPQPSLAEHEWNPDLVLISIRQDFGDGGTDIGDMGSPPFILYADGNLFVDGVKNINGKDYGQVLTKKLNREEICQYLNTLDQIGYLDYDPSSYVFLGDKPSVLGSPTTSIMANSWKHKSQQIYYELGYFLQQKVVDAFYGQNGYPVISPALRNTYYFLNQYSTDGFEVYKPNRLAVWIVPAEYVFPDNFESISQVWQLKNLSFNSLLKRIDTNPKSSNEYTTILIGDEAREVYNYLGEAETKQVFVIDMRDGNKKYYALFARPLLPYEVLGDYGMSEIPAPGSPEPNFKLTCYPSDGVLPIPSPSNP